jgi:GTP-binding protein LepA
MTCSAKTGEGVAPILERIITDVPPPSGDKSKPLKALVFDSKFDSFRGAIAYVRVVDGTLKKGDKIQFLSTGRDYDVDEIGYFRYGRVRRMLSFRV